MTDSGKLEGYVDALAVVGYLSGESAHGGPPATKRPVAAGEVHLFTYLGCLLSLYREQPTAKWGYAFVRINSGLPFADSLSEALDGLLRSGLVERVEDAGFLITARGRDALRQFETLRLTRDRVAFIRAGCDAAITIPPATIRHALNAEPGLRTASNRALHATLGSEGARETLYQQFKVLHRLVGLSIESLLVPAITWLTYLAETMGPHLVSQPNEQTS
jgi:hypothetical protein